MKRVPFPPTCSLARDVFPLAINVYTVAKTSNPEQICPCFHTLRREAPAAYTANGAKK